MFSRQQNGMIHLSSPYTVLETLARLQTIIQSKGLTIFAQVDHSGEAAKVGLTMPPTELLIFGNAQAGTPFDDSLSWTRHRPASQGVSMAG
jgi:uncharacterized protein (DUF302 family)